MKQHEALRLALSSPIKGTAKSVLIAVIMSCDFETWEKPMSVSYIKRALGNTVSDSVISRALASFQKLGIITRYSTGRADGVRTIKLNTDALMMCQNDSPVKTTYPTCQNDIPSMSKRHRQPVESTYNIISNNQLTNQNYNQFYISDHDQVRTDRQAIEERQRQRKKLMKMTYRGDQ